MCNTQAEESAPLRGKLYASLTVTTGEVVLREETIREEGKVLRDVLRKELGKGARDTVGLDRERDSIFCSLHEPGVGVRDGERTLQQIQNIHVSVPYMTNHTILHSSVDDR